MTFAASVTEWSISVARRSSHDEVRVEHVLLGIATLLHMRKLIDDESVARWSAQLPKPGSAYQPPVISADAQRLLDRCTNMQAGVRILREFAVEPGFPEPEATPRKARGDNVGSQRGTDDSPTRPTTEPDPHVAPSPQGKKGNPSEPEDRDAVLAEAMAELDCMIGLEQVKTQIRNLVSLQKMNVARRRLGQAPVSAGLHLVFTGAPGTGKTTVARIVSRIYYGLGLLPSPHCVEVDRSGLVAAYVGATSIKTAEAIESARGGVLFIDEAYSLSTGGSPDYGQEAMAVLVKRMEDLRGEIAVVVAGYEDRMLDFIKGNPGLESRFQTYIDFPPYSSDELIQIFESLCRDHGIECDTTVLNELRTVLTDGDTSQAGGNARNVRNLFETMARSMAERADADGRIDAHEINAFTVDDIRAVRRSHGRDRDEAVLSKAMADLDRLVGLAEVKKQVRDLVALQKVNAGRIAQGHQPLPASLHLVFTGSPGTGKTTVARIVARAYQGLGILRTGHLVEASRSDLVAGYLGQTALKTEAVIRTAAGGVLFIDEAYSLTTDERDFYGSEAIAILVKDMEDRRGDLAVVIAGYEEEMRNFVESNPGLRSRFQNFVHFPDYSASELLQIFRNLCADHAIVCPAEVEVAVLDHLDRSNTSGDGGNGRYVRGLFEQMALNLAVRAADEHPETSYSSRNFAVSDLPPPRDGGPKVRAGFRP